MFIKRALRGFLLSLLPLLLIGLALSWGAKSVIGDRQNVKNILNDSRVYETIVPNLLSESSKQTENGSLALASAEIKNAANESFSPALIKQSAEDIIDGTYDWLEGKTSQPSFNVDLSAAKANFAERAAAATSAKAASLPRCPSSVSGDNFDAFKAECLPRGLTPAMAAERVKNSILTGEEVLEQPNITPQTVKNEETGQSVFTELDTLPATYQQLMNMPVYFGLLAILASVGAILLSSSRVNGLRRVGLVIAIVGILMAVFSFLVSGVVKSQLNNLNLGGSSIETDMQKFFGSLADKIADNNFIFGVVYLGLGITMVAVAIWWQRKNKVTAAEKPITA